MNSNLLSRLAAVGLAAAAVLGFGAASASAAPWGYNEHVKIMAEYGSTMFVSDHDTFSETHNNANVSGFVFGKLSGWNLSFANTLSTCAGDEVRADLVVKGLTYNGDRSAKITAQLKLFEGTSCATQDLDGVSAPVTFTLKPGESTTKWFSTYNSDEGGDVATASVKFGAVLGAGV